MALPQHRVNCAVFDPTPGPCDCDEMAGGQPKQSFKIGITPEGAINMVLLAHGVETHGVLTEKLVEMLKIYWRGGYDAAKAGEPRS